MALERPTILYEMFFYLELPGGHTTDRVTKTIYGGDTAYQSDGVFMVRSICYTVCNESVYWVQFGVTVDLFYAHLKYVI